MTYCLSVWCDYKVVFLYFCNKQLCNTIVCLISRLSLDIRFRMMDAIFRGQKF